MFDRASTNCTHARMHARTYARTHTQEADREKFIQLTRNLGGGKFRYVARTYGAADPIIVIVVAAAINIIIVVIVAL